VNPFRGGDICLGEVYRLKHVGTGKYLSLGDDYKELILRDTANSLNTLFVFKSDMSTKTTDQYIEDEFHAGEKANPDIHKLGSGERVMLSGYIDGKMLQLFDIVPQKQVKQFIHSPLKVERVNMDEQSQKKTQLRLISHGFDSTMKQQKYLQMEYVPADLAKYAYRATLIFKELLVFYAFLNSWAVIPNPNRDHPESFKYDNEAGLQGEEDLIDRVHRLAFILSGLRTIVDGAYQEGEEELKKCKDELTEQGILHILLHTLTMIYYKETPPVLFERPFKSDKAEDGGQRVDLAKIKIEDYIPQMIARKHLDATKRKMLEIVLELVRAHRKNSEKMTVFIGMLYQHYAMQENYFEIGLH
jgi:hypothetical protein